MRKFLSLGCALAAVAAYAAPNGGQKPAADVAAKKAEFYKNTGGLIRRPNSGSGKVVFVNAQGRFKASDLQSLASKLSDSLRIDIEVIPGRDVNFGNAAGLIKAAKAPSGVIAAELDASMPELIVVPDKGYSIVNIAAFPGDASVKYFQKQLARGFAASSGAMTSQYPLTLMSAFENSKKLEALPVDELPVDVVMRVKNALKLNGVAPYSITTYKHACREGWAHQPTNEVERAIWKEMHDAKERGPINAIKIQP